MAKPAKSNLFRRKWEYLGHLVRGEVQRLAAEINVLREYPKPGYKHQPTSFILVGAFPICRTLVKTAR